MAEVSLTNLYERFMRSHPEAGGSELELQTENSDRFLGCAIRQSLCNFSQTFAILTTLCNVYKELKELAGDNQKGIYEFLVDYSRQTADRLVAEGKLNTLLLAKLHTFSLAEEVRYFESDQALIDMLPIHLSSIANGKFAVKFSEALKAIREDNPSSAIQKIVNKLKEKKQQAKSLLEAMAGAYGFLEETEDSLYIQQSEENISKRLNSGFVLEAEGNLGKRLVQEQVIKVFLFVESYRRLCTADNSHNGILLSILLDILKLNII